MRTSRLQRRIGAITLPFLVIALAACGGGSSGSQVASLNGAGGNGNALATDTTLSVQDREQKLLEFAACMRKNGVDMKDPTFDATGNMTGGGFGRNSGIDPRSTEFQAGMKTCGSIIQGIGFGRNRRGGNFDPAKMQAAFNDYTSCLRSNGLTQVKDITFGRPGGDNGGQGGQNGGGNGGQTGTGGGVFGGGGNGATGGATNGSVPPGGFDGPPPGGSRPDDNGNAPGGAGFDPSRRIIERLGLDTTDPTVQKATEACKAILTNAFTNNTTTTTAG